MMMMNKCAKVGTTRGATPPVKHKNRLQVGTEGLTKRIRKNVKHFFQYEENEMEKGAEWDLMQ